MLENKCKGEKKRGNQSINQIAKGQQKRPREKGERETCPKKTTPFPPNIPPESTRLLKHCIARAMAPMQEKRPG